MFNNKKFEGIHYSRFVASWTNTVGPIGPEFVDWLKTVTVNGKRIPEDIIDEIYEMGNTGMFELEISAVAFAEKLKNEKKKKEELNEMVDDFRKAIDSLKEQG